MQLGRKWFYVTMAVAVAAVAGSGVGLYYKLSSHAAPEAIAGHVPTTAAPAAASQSTVPNPAAPSMEVAAERLAQRLKQQGGTGDDWALLARSYVHLQRYPEAVDAFAKALELSPGDKALVEGQEAARRAAGVSPAR
jgi:cytochrome c-type biogenesis protein CcmH/NrfG